MPIFLRPLADFHCAPEGCLTKIGVVIFIPDAWRADKRHAFHDVL